MKEYRRILWKNKKMTLSLGLLKVLTSALSVAAGYSLSGILNSYEAEGDKLHALLIAVLTAAGLYAVGILFDHCVLVFQLKVQRIIKNDLRKLVSHKIASLSYDAFHQKDSGAYVSWLSNDVEQIYTNCFEGLYTGISQLSAAVFAFAVMVANSWYLGMIAVVLFVLQFSVPQLCNKFLIRAEKRRSEALEVSMEAYKDSIMGVGIFYLSNLRERIAQRIGEASDTVEREVFLSKRTSQRVQTLQTVISLSNQIILMGVAMLAAMRGDAPLGIAFAVGNLCGQFFNGVRYGVQAIMNIRSTKALWEKFELQEEKAESKAALPPLEQITMEKVSFSYGDHTILQEKNLSFEAGGKYAILGESGSGKTTVLKLLMGLLPGYEGQICYDGCEQQQADLSSLYEQVAYVDQQVYLFQDSLRFNITLGQPYSDEEIMAAVKACKLEELVASLPQGLDTLISENGKNLSGGQRQRIALARGIIRKVRYMILDEGTSALDEDNALDIEQNLMETEGLGVIIITHHLHDSIKPQLTKAYLL